MKIQIKPEDKIVLWYMLYWFIVLTLRKISYLVPNFRVDTIDGSSFGALYFLIFLIVVPLFIIVFN